MAPSVAPRKNRAARRPEYELTKPWKVVTRPQATTSAGSRMLGPLHYVSETSSRSAPVSLSAHIFLMARVSGSSATMYGT
jgi:hypothetical protein